VNNPSVQTSLGIFSPGIHNGNEADRQTINTLLKSYTDSVKSGDQERFESLLLHLDIPFSGLRNLALYDANDETVDVRNYKTFKASIFDSGIAFDQQFYNLKIEQEGNLAQVSLDFVTTKTACDTQVYGWKVLHLLKIRGTWKIASEFYTANPLERGGETH
jgi:hypothetical protein